MSGDDAIRRAPSIYVMYKGELVGHGSIFPKTPACVMNCEPSLSDELKSVG